MKLIKDDFLQENAFRRTIVEVVEGKDRRDSVKIFLCFFRFVKYLLLQKQPVNINYYNKA